MALVGKHTGTGALIAYDEGTGALLCDPSGLLYDGDIYFNQNSEPPPEPPLPPPTAYETTEYLTDGINFVSANPSGWYYSSDEVIQRTYKDESGETKYYDNAKMESRIRQNAYPKPDTMWNAATIGNADAQLSIGGLGRDEKATSVRVLGVFACHLLRFPVVTETRRLSGGVAVPDRIDVDDVLVQLSMGGDGGVRRYARYAVFDEKPTVGIHGGQQFYYRGRIGGRPTPPRVVSLGLSLSYDPRQESNQPYLYIEMNPEDAFLNTGAYVRDGWLNVVGTTGGTRLYGKIHFKVPDSP